MRDGDQIPVAVSGGKKIHGGSLVVVLPTGFAAPGLAALGVSYLGRAENSVDNTDGEDGDAFVNVRRNKVFKWKNSPTDPIGQESMGKACFIEDDETLASSDGEGSLSMAGTVVGIDPDGIWLEQSIPPFMKTEQN
jgi:hypothetical protein